MTRAEALFKREVASDLDLFEGIRARDVRAFEQLYKRYHPRLTRFLLNLVRRPQLVEEAVNDTMMVVWSRIDTFGQASRPSTWMFGIAYRQGLTALRRSDDPVDDAWVAEQPDPAPPPETALSQDQARGRLQAAIGALSPAHRAVVNLTYAQGFGYREIAEIVDCPVDTVKTRMFHARRQLKKTLGGELVDWL